MSQTVLARKWRPKAFSELVGQEHISRALSNALDSNRLHHAYLFSGTRGVGKTTIARILAKCLNCEVGISSTPCGECISCIEISNDKFIDLIEVDAASRTGVDDMRDLLSNAQYLPARGRFKVYLIDEIHMLSKSSFAALLKTLEEPPEHVKFLFATTDDKKLPVTILSRCLHFSLRSISTPKIKMHLEQILQKETISFCEQAIFAIAKAADGSIRDGLSLLDQAIGIGDSVVDENSVQTMLGSVDKYYLVDICRHIAMNNPQGLFECINAMSETSPDYYDALDQIIAIFYDIAVMQAIPESSRHASIDEDISSIAERFSKEDIQLFYQICLLGKRDLHLSSDERIGFEMIMLRCLSFKPAESPYTLSEKINRNLDKNNERVVNSNEKLPEHQEKVDKFDPGLELTKSTKSKLSFDQFNPETWIDLSRQLNLKTSLGEIVNNCVVEKIFDNCIYFNISEESNSLLNDNHERELTKILSDYFKMDVSVKISSKAHSSETPKLASDREHQMQVDEAFENLNSDPSIKKFKEIFDGSVDIKSVQLESK